jgi:L-amino acid N-acyltransferase YncA/DNA-binding transcriptional ArsR family regulator
MAVDTVTPQTDTLAPETADTYAAWFACMGEPTRLRLLHAVASAPGSLTVGALAQTLGLGQPTVSHHLRKLADINCVTLTKDGTATRVAINAACCAVLPHAIDVVMGLLSTQPCCPTDLPTDVTTRAMTSEDFDDVRRIYAEGIATGDATFDTEVPTATALDAAWLTGHRWIAELDGAVVGWAAAAPTTARDHYSGVAETSVSVSTDAQGRGVGKALLYRQVTEADRGGLWTLQTSVFPENKAGLALHRSAGYRTIGVRERVARHHGRWRDTVLMERRRAED